MVIYRTITCWLLACIATSAWFPFAYGEEESWNARFQTTYVWQGKAPFNAAYNGRNSLSPEREKSYSFTGTAFLGMRPWAGGELYFNPEVAQGVPLSNLTGLGGLSNGEIARTSGPNPKLYMARAFLRQSWGLGDIQDAVDSGANQLAGKIYQRQIVLTVGKLSVTDIFDNNVYSHDPRTQFINWSLMTAGAYDYAADARGYSWGAALEYYYDDWILHAGRFTQPKLPNQLVLDRNILNHYGDQIEAGHGHVLFGQPGKIRLLAFRNRTLMSRFQDALDYAALHGGVPNINNVRNGDKIKYGFGLNLEQQLIPNIGVFSRVSWADGKTETYAFTEIDHSLAAGTVIQGNAWSRIQDSIGIAFVQNGLSRQRRDYLSAGGISFFIGDGALNYRPENILETYYSLGAIKNTWLTLDYQHIHNPAYNRDRGPVSLGAVRLRGIF
ncbi:MAG: carbohydrate porin [Nitrosomonadales bacterium]|nr:carbohydrate porin [Nitrosomonadales bacterium]